MFGFIAGAIISSIGAYYKQPFWVAALVILLWMVTVDAIADRVKEKR